MGMIACLQVVDDLRIEQLLSKDADDLFAEIEEMVERDYTVLPSKLPLVEGVSPVYYLGSSLHMLSLADAILLCDGWVKARGCRIEYQVAKLYGIPILFEYDL